MPGSFPTAIDGALGVMEQESNFALKSAQMQNIRSETAVRNQTLAMDMAMAPLKTKLMAAQARSENAKADQIEMQLAVQKRVQEALARNAKAMLAQGNQQSDITSADLSKNAWSMYDLLAGAGDIAGAEKAAQSAAAIDRASATVRNADTNSKRFLLDEMYKNHQINSTDYKNHLDGLRTDAYLRNIGNEVTMRGKNYDLNVQKYLSGLDQKDWTQKEKGMMDQSLLNHRQKQEAHEKIMEELAKDRNVQTYNHMHKTEAQRNEELLIQQKRLAKGKIGKAPELLPGERYLKDSTDFISSKYKDMEAPEARMLGADLASRAQEIAKAHQGITWRDALGQAFADMHRGGAFSNMKAYANGRSPETGQPLPADKKDLKAGTWYNSQHGPVFWDGKQGLTPDEYKLEEIRKASKGLEPDDSEDDPLNDFENE